MTDALKRANTERESKVTQADLPFSCPPKDSRIWDSHPRVFLPLGQEDKGEIIRQVECPYCAAAYALVD